MSIHDFADPRNTEVAPAPEPPHNIQLEQALLGALLIDNKLHERISAKIDAGHFYDPLHAHIYAVATRLIEGNRLANPITLKTFVEGIEPISDDLTVPQYLGRLVARSVTLRPDQVSDYANAMADLAMRRQMVTVAQEMLAAAMDAETDTPADKIIEQAERGLYEIAERRTSNREISMADAVGQAMDAIAKAYQHPGSVTGLPTGLVDLDAKLGGLQKSDLIVIAGRPSMGKTALATNIAQHVAGLTVADDDGIVVPQHVHFFSMEMSAEQLASRMIAEKASVAADALRRGTITESQFRDLTEHAKRVATGALTIDETGGVSIGALAAKARREKRKHGTKLIVVDYIQLMSGSPNKRGQNRVGEVTDITTGLKALAKELDVPIIALSQLSREVEKRSDKRPQLSDLRDSGSVEQDADCVIFVYRDEYYIEREKPDDSDISKYADWCEKMDRARGKAEAIIGKQRHGPTGIVPLAFDGRYTRFSNLAHETSHGR